MNSRSFCLSNDREVSNDQAKSIDQGPKSFSHLNLILIQHLANCIMNPYEILKECSK